MLMVATAGVCACGDAPTEHDDAVALGRRYVEDASYRRAVLTASLVNADNGYSLLRLQRYVPAKWGALPVWAPDGFDDVESVPWERQALLELGERAFFGYPMQLVPALEHGLESPERFGVQGGIVHVAVGNDAVGQPRRATALTCAACHSAVVEGATIAGLNNAEFDLQGMILEARALPRGPSWWGPGRVDVTPDDLDNPTAIPDLRPVRYQTHLHRAATVRNGLIELTIRTETLIITAMGQNLRPPRKLAFALALYLWELAPPPPLDRPAAFAQTCGGCHGSEGLAGPPVEIGRVGTADEVALSPSRTTGMWRVPSLVGAGRRERLMASGEIDDLVHLLDPGRTVPGHPFGQGLTAAERVQILEFLGAGRR
jgi:mono/diheme cytochrome c family protein